jgi:hypothetical protein
MKHKHLLLIISLLIGVGICAQPTISSFSPSSGPTGSTVTINGSGFDNIFTNNAVFIGGIRANVVSSTVNQIDVIVPAGLSGKNAITVINLSNMDQATTDLEYTVTFSYGITSSITADKQYENQTSSASGPNLSGESTNQHTGKKMVAGDFGGR